MSVVVVNVTDIGPVHPLNAELEIDVIPLGILISELVSKHPAKTLSGIAFNLLPVGNVRVVNLVHPWNALVPIEVSEAGSVTLIKPPLMQP